MFSHLVKLLDFLYQGEVNIDQEELNEFLSLCNDLKIKGVTEDSVDKMKESKCFVNQGTDGKKPRFYNSPHQNVNDETNNVNKLNSLLPVHWTNDFIKDSKQQEHDTCKENQSMVMIPSEILKGDFEIKIEMHDSSFDPKIENYAKDSNSHSEKIEDKNKMENHIEKGKNRVGENIDQSKLRVRDIAKLSKNTLETPVVSTEKDVKEDFNSLNFQGQSLSIPERIENCFKNFSENSSSSKQDNKDFLRKRTPHIKPAHDRKTYSCTECDYASSTKSNLKEHIRSTCSKNFTKIGQLNVHTFTHNGEKPLRPFQCEVCPKRFIKSGQLKVHTRTHTEEKSFQCEFCPKKFAQSSNLERHTKIHFQLERNISSE